MKNKKQNKKMTQDGVSHAAQSSKAREREVSCVARVTCPRRGASPGHIMAVVMETVT
jgi:hypothetical protein